MIKVRRTNKVHVTVSPEDIILSCDEYVIVSDLSKVECHINYEDVPDEMDEEGKRKEGKRAERYG